MPVPPVGVTIVRVDDSRLLVSTNQPAYLAVFEIVPNRGVTLVYPASPRQRQMALAGSSWLDVSWRSARGVEDDDRDERGRRITCTSSRRSVRSVSPTTRSTTARWARCWVRA
jgi:hypothetical protein